VFYFGIGVRIAKASVSRDGNFGTALAGLTTIELNLLVVNAARHVLEVTRSFLAENISNSISDWKAQVTKKMVKNKGFLIMKKLFPLLAILIYLQSWSLKSEEQQNCPSTCQSLYWYKVYNELAEKLRYLSVLAGKSDLIPCSGYFGNSEIEIKNFKSQISFGGAEGWTYDPMKKGKNNSIYYKNEKRRNYTPGLSLCWRPDRPTWQDRAGGKTGIYDEGIDVIVYDGGQDCPHPLKNGDKGISDGSIYYFDNNGNDRWDVDEEVWQDSVCNMEIFPLAWDLQKTVYDLCENYYVDPNFQEGDFTGLEYGDDIPYLLKKDENGDYAQYSRIKLFPDRQGEDAYSFTQIPSYLPDGTKIMDSPVYSKSDFYFSYDNCPFIFPVFFDEIRQILNMNIIRSAWIKNPNWTSNGENNMKSAVVDNKISMEEAYFIAVTNYNTSTLQADVPPCAIIYYYKYGDWHQPKDKYACEIYRAYSHLGMPSSFGGIQTLKFNADFYITASGKVFNNNGDTPLIQDRWCRFAQEFQCTDVNIKKKFGGSLNLPQISDLSKDDNFEGYGSVGAVLIHNIIPFNIPPFEESYPANDTNRDDLYDTGVDLNGINNETGTIVHSPDMDEPQVILPLRWNSIYSNSPQYPEYLSMSGIQNKSFILTATELSERICQDYFSLATPKSDDIGAPLYQSSRSYLFLDLFIDDISSVPTLKQ
jgi:hypothetical protein